MYKSWGAAIKNMDDAQAGALLKAIYAYQAGEETELDGAISFVFDLIRDKFEDDAEKYERECQKKAENGRKGGLAKAKSAKQELASAKSAKQELASAKSAKQEPAEVSKASKTKQNLHDTDTESDTDTDALIDESENTRARGNASQKKPDDAFTLSDQEEKELAGSMGDGNLARYKAKVKDWYLDHERSLSRSYAAEIKRWYEADLKARPRGKPPRNFTERDNRAIYAELERLSLGGEP